jgi:hypothetical protein
MASFNKTIREFLFNFNFIFFNYCLSINICREHLSQKNYYNKGGTASRPDLFIITDILGISSNDNFFGNTFFIYFHSCLSRPEFVQMYDIGANRQYLLKPCNEAMKY